MPWPRVIVFLSALSLPAMAREAITFDDHVLPVFRQACLNCHNPDKIKGGLDLSTFGAVMKGGSGGRIVEPGDFSASSLIALVEHTAEPRMPPKGDKLPAAQIDLLKHWIEDGLRENKHSGARKPAKPEFAATMKTDTTAPADGPPPMPADLLLEPPVTTAKPGPVQALACSPRAPLLAATAQKQVLLFHTGTLELLGILPFPDGQPLSLAFTPDGRRLLAAGGTPGKSGLAVLYDVTTGEKLAETGGEFDSLLAADISPDLSLVAGGGPSRLLKLRETASGETTASLKKHTDWITALDISPDGVLLASGDRNGGVQVWETSSGNEFHTLRGHQAGITAAVFRADSDILATASEDGTIRFWEMNGGTEIRKIAAHPGGATAFAFSRDGRFLTAGRDRKLKFWKTNFSLGRELAANLPSPPTAVALDAEGKRAFAADASGFLHAWQTDDGKSLGKRETNPPSIARRLARLRSEPASTPGVQNRISRWIAADINTRRLASQAGTRALSSAIEENRFSFSRAASAVGERFTALARVRRETTALAAIASSSDLSPAAREEARATLEIVGKRKEKEETAFRESEQTLLEIRGELDEQAAAHARSAAGTALLETQYRAALSEPGQTSRR